MKLKEVAFMISLINANYHRRMAYLWVNVIAAVFSAAIIYYNLVIDYKDYHGPLLFIVFGVLGLFFSVFRAFIVYGLHSGNNDPSLPWNIKKNQMKILRQCVDSKVDFEDLRCYVTLHEYFELN